MVYKKTSHTGRDRSKKFPNMRAAITADVNKIKRLLKKNTRENIAEANELRSVIYQSIKVAHNEQRVEFILETLAKIGRTPYLIYDDNGRWALSDNAIATTVSGDKKIDGSVNVIVSKVMWFPTVRKAIGYYLNSEI